MYNFFIVNCPILFCFELFFCSTVIYFVFPWFVCSPNFLTVFSISTKSCLISISFFPTNTMSSAYGYTFSCCLPIFIPLGTIFILCITFCNAKLNNVGINIYALPIKICNNLKCVKAWKLILKNYKHFLQPKLHPCFSICFSSWNPKKTTEVAEKHFICPHKLKYKITYQHLFISFVHYIEQINR